MTPPTDNADLRAALEASLIDRNETRFNAIAFVHRHEILAALAQPAPPTEATPPHDGLRDRLATVVKAIDDGRYASIDDRINAILAALNIDGVGA